MTAETVWAIPGKSWLYTIEGPDGLSQWGKESFEEAKANNPGLCRMSYSAWLEDAATRQDSEPLEWIEETEDQYIAALEVLPPVAWTLGVFGVGEPADHSFRTGKPRFQAHKKRGSHYSYSSRPLTTAEIYAEAQR